MTICELCKNEVSSADLCMANRYEAGQRTLIPVHRDCIDKRSRKLAVEAWMASPELRRRVHQWGMTFKEWRESGCPSPFTLWGPEDTAA
jgi:hypothetical protein